MLARWQRTVVDPQGNIVPSAQLIVRRESDQALATVYRDRDGTNPYPSGLVTADANGYAYFYADLDLYRISSAEPVIDWRDVEIGGSAALREELSGIGGSGAVGFSHDVIYDPGTIGDHAKHVIYPTDAPFGAAGDGIADDLAVLTAITSVAGRHICLGGKSYRISDTLVPAQGVTITGPGKIFRTTHGTILDASAGGIQTWGFEMEGAGNTEYVPGSNAIVAHGTTNAGAAPTYVSGFKARMMRIHGVADMAMSLNYVDDADVQFNEMYDLGRSGVECIGCTDTIVDFNNIHDISPGKTGDAYGIIFTRDAVSTDLIQRPRSERCRAVGNRIRNNPTYVGINTHAGNDILIHGNYIANCRVPVDIVSSSIGGVDDHAANNVTCTDNTLIGINKDPCIRAVPGASGTTGSPTEWGAGLVIAGNTCVNGGNDADTLTGGILVQDSLGAVVQGNTIINPAKYGILFFHDNKGFTCAGNTIIDPHSATLTVPSGIHVNDDYNVGVIEGNALIRHNPSLDTYVAVRGIFENSGKAHNIITVGPNSFAGGWPTEYVLSTAAQDPHTESHTVTGTTNTSASTLTLPVTWNKPFSSSVRIAATMLNSAIGPDVLVASVASKTTEGAVIRVMTGTGGNFADSVSVSVDVVATGY